MISRQKMILREIIANYFGESEEKLCKMGNITSKTFKSDMQIIEKALDKYHLKINEKDNRYFIPFELKKDFLKAYEEIIEEDDKQVLALENTERKIRILIDLCKMDCYLSMNLLADNLYVSKTSVSSLIHELEEEIPVKVKEAKLEVSGRKGVKLIASEKQRRELLVRFFAMDESKVKSNLFLLMYLEKNNIEKIEPVIRAVSHFLRINNFEISNNNIDKLIMHVLIILQRQEHNCHLDKQDIIFSPLYDDLKDELKKENIEIKTDELSSLPLLRLNRAILVNPIVNDIIKEFVEEIKEEYHTDILRLDDTKSLASHIDEIVSKGLSSYVKKDFVLEQMLQRLLNAYLICGNLCKIIKKYTGMDIDNEHRFYMAMHIQWLYRKNIYVNEKMLLYDSNISECEMIKIDLEKHFGSKATIIPVNIRWEINQILKENQIAIILSTNSILDDFGNVPFLKINSFLSDEDYRFIDKIVYKNKDVKVIKAQYDEETNIFTYDNKELSLDNEIVEINNILFTHTVNSNLPMAVFEVSKDEKRLFVFNYNKNSDFLKYHRMVNSFGQMIKEKKI